MDALADALAGADGGLTRIREQMDENLQKSGLSTTQRSGAQGWRGAGLRDMSLSGARVSRDRTRAVRPGA